MLPDILNSYQGPLLCSSHLISWHSSSSKYELANLSSWAHPHVFISTAIFLAVYLHTWHDIIDHPIPLLLFLCQTMSRSLPAFFSAEGLSAGPNECEVFLWLILSAHLPAPKLGYVSTWLFVISFPMTGAYMPPLFFSKAYQAVHNSSNFHGPTHQVWEFLLVQVQCPKSPISLA